MLKKSIMTLLILSSPLVFAEESKQAILTTPTVIPVETFFKRAEFEEMKISPGGEFVAVTVPLEDNKTILAVLDRASMKPKAAVPMRNSEMVDRFWWVNNTRLVVTVATKNGGIDTPQPTGELYAINADGTDAKAIFGMRANDGGDSHIKHAQARNALGVVISTLPNNDKEILIAAHDFGDKEGAVPTIERLNVYTGKTTKIGAAPARRAELMADHKGLVRIAASETVTQSNQLWYRESGEGDWKLINDQQVSGVRMQPLMFTRDNQHLYIQATEKAGPDAIYRLDPKTGEKEKVYSGDADPVRLLSTADHEDAYGVLTADGKFDVALFDEHARETSLAKALKTSFKSEAAYFSSFTKDGKYGVVTAFSDRNPGDFYLFDLEKKSATRIASRQQWIDPEKMAEMQPINFQARDGLTLHGYLTLPLGVTGKNLPLIVNPHGGPHGVRDFWSYDPEVQLLANRGYAVLQLNYRGSGGYGLKFMEAGYNEWGGKMQDDLTDATLWAVKEGYADRNRLGIYGASYGGYATLEGLVKEPELYKCGIGYAGVYDLRMMYSRGDIQQSLLGEKFLEMVIGTNRDDLYARSPVSQLDKLKAAVMIVHGGQDQRVPIGHAKALKRLLDERHYPYEWLVEEGEGHGFYKQEHRIAFYNQLLAFLDKQLSARKPVTVLTQ